MHKFATLVLAGLAAIALSACAIRGDWRLQEQGPAIRYYEREYPGSAIPEFRAVARIRASMPAVMSVLTDFAGYPDWVHQCQSVHIIDTQGFTEAYLYQVSDLPLINDRDMLIHGKITPREPGKHIVIELKTAPDYCEGKTSRACEVPQSSDLVRVRQSAGTFDLKQVDEDWVELSWQQHIDPAGAVPAWATRLMLKDVPLKSLGNLKAMVENEQDNGN